MDNSNPQQPNPAPQPAMQTPPVATEPMTPPVGPATPPSPTPVVTPAEKGSSKKMVFMLIGGFVLVLGIVGVIYYFLSMRQQAQTQVPEVVTQTPAPASQTVPVESLEGEVNGVSIGDLETEFSTIEADVNSL